MNALIQLASPNLKKSQLFYEKLSFNKIDANTYSDGFGVFSINEKRTARNSLILFSNSWKNEVEKLRAKTKVVETEDGFLFADYSGCPILLKETENPYQNWNMDHKSHLGNFMGLSLESIRMNDSMELF